MLNVLFVIKNIIFLLLYIYLVADIMVKLNI
jgi:hypothetical protein